ncbi:hypothetical protein OSB04_030351 [Centaurea solstitialis]|uniref:DC1 domain-containing protein n=1 Tax=Centaurea solstitialis TaxID=347529 RepID=A0AA38SEY9_9ASTR|nr:hypothetical protein OSB04_030351 [Centaurea solstitialis]
MSPEKMTGWPEKSPERGDRLVTFDSSIVYTIAKGDKLDTFWGTKPFYVCAQCGLAITLKEEACIKVNHEGHPQHTLTFQLRLASFHCDACHATDEDFLYQCDSCDFWIHKACTSLPSIVNLPHHHHSLILVYSLPDNFYKYDYYCEFCKKSILQNGWLYHCGNCRYFSHIFCSLNAEQYPVPSDALGTSAVEECVDDFLHFPMSNALMDPLRLLHVGNMAREDNATGVIIIH